MARELIFLCKILFYFFCISIEIFIFYIVNNDSCILVTSFGNYICFGRKKNKVLKSVSYFPYRNAYMPTIFYYRQTIEMLISHINCIVIFCIWILKRSLR